MRLVLLIVCRVDFVQVESYEDGDRRIIKTTGICWGWKLNIVAFNPLYDGRLNSHHSFEQVAIPFTEYHKAVGSEEEWRWVGSMFQPFIGRACFMYYRIQAHV